MPAAAYGRRRASSRRGGQVTENLTKLFPAEAVAAYPLAAGAAGDSLVTRIVLVAVILLAVVALRYFATQPPGGGRPDWQAIWISVISFLLWVAALGGFGVLLVTQERTTMLISMATILWLGLVSCLPARPVPAKPVRPGKAAGGGKAAAAQGNLATRLKAAAEAESAGRPAGNKGK